MNLHPEPEFSPIAAKRAIPGLLATRSQRINPWITADAPAATVCATDSGYEIAEARVSPAAQSYRVLTGQERKRHFGLARLDPDKPSPTITKGQPDSSTTGLFHPYETRHLTIPEIKALSSFPEQFRIEGRFREKWARIGNSVPPLFMRAIAMRVREAFLDGGREGC